MIPLRIGAALLCTLLWGPVLRRSILVLDRPLPVKVLDGADNASVPIASAVLEQGEWQFNGQARR